MTESRESFLEHGCKQCIRAFMCKGKDILEANPALDSLMTGCRFLSNNTISSGNTINPSTISRRNVVTDTADISRKIKNLTKKSEEEFKVIPPSPDKACECCGKTDVQLVKCSECGKLICPDCETDTMDGEILCPDCYDKRPSDIF